MQNVSGIRPAPGDDIPTAFAPPTNPVLPSIPSPPAPTHPATLILSHPLFAYYATHP